MYIIISQRISVLTLGKQSFNFYSDSEVKFINPSLDEKRRKDYGE